jgi:hypothetical protein
VVLTQYAYLADIVKNSGTVGWREVIGHIGTGRHGPVLHFEVRRANMSEAPPDYWPSSDNKDVDWVRQHYFAPTQFIRTHYRILSLPATSTPPTTPAAPGDTTAPGGGTGGGSASPPGSPGPTPPWNSPGTVPGSFPLFPGEQPSSPPPTTTPFPSAWDGVPHLDGSILRSGTGDYYLLQSGKKWRIGGSDVLSTWARPEEALPATDVELASYPDGAHPLGLRIGTWFQGSSGPVCISADPFEEPGLACWVVMDEDWLARVGLSRGAIKTVSAQTMALYIRPGQFDQNTPLPRGVLIQKPYGGYYVVEDLTGYLPEVHPVTSSAALHSWQIDETMAVQIGSPDFWDRVLKLDPVPFRPGAILKSSTGQLYVVSGQYKYLVPSMDVLVRRGYNAANAIFATDADLALEKDWPTPLR